jgi:Zn-dependent M28 family amino/carboxypeptidase
MKAQISALAGLGLAASLAVALAGHALAQSSQPPSTPIDPQRLSDEVKELSADSFEGRGPATLAEPKVIDWIITHMKAAGLKPAGEHGGWTQDVPLARFELTGPIHLAMTYGGQAHALTQTQEIVVRAERPVDRVKIENAPIVFVGYGVSAPEVGWDDFKGVDVKGKIIVCLVNDPDFAAQPGEDAYGKFGGKAETYYGRWTYKYEEAARRGAIGMLIIHETAPASYGWNTVKNSNGNAQFDIVRDNPAASHPLVEGWIQYDLAKALFQASGLDLEAEKVHARSAAFRPVVLKGDSFSADYAVDHQKIISHNVLGKVEGTLHPDQTILYTAHWDHLGVGQPDAKGDRIYNGAIDNADGVASILEIGRQFASGPAPQRTVIIMSVTAEEKNLLGTEYYASHPLYPLAKTVADINIDALSGSGPARDISVSGDSKGELQDLLVAMAERQGRHFTPDAEPEAGHFFRSDHFPFAKRGVPALSIESGHDLYEGGVAVGKAKAEAYVAQRYHQPADEWDTGLDFRGMAIDDGLAYELGRDLANSTVWPGWKPASEFKAVRDATARERP